MAAPYYDFNDFIYVKRSDGYASKRYKHWCSSCLKDRGYGYKNKILKTPFCHSCKMKQQEVLSKISKNSKKLRQSPESRAKISASMFKRYGSNPINRRIAVNLRSRLNQALKNNYKAGSAIRELGCSIEELKSYLESKFYNHPKTGEPMSWANYGRNGWHIDHVVPLCKFDLSDKVQLRKACNFRNLQPLWREDNLEKRHVDGTF